MPGNVSAVVAPTMTYETIKIAEGVLLHVIQYSNRYVQGQGLLEVCERMCQLNRARRGGNRGCIH